MAKKTLEVTGVSHNCGDSTVITLGDRSFTVPTSMLQERGVKEIISQGAMLQDNDGVLSYSGDGHYCCLYAPGR